MRNLVVDVLNIVVVHLMHVFYLQIFCQVLISMHDLDMAVLVNEILNPNICFRILERRTKGILLLGEGLLLLLFFLMVRLLIVEMLSLFVMRKVVDRLVLFHYFLIGSRFIFKNTDLLNYLYLFVNLLNLQIILVDFLFTKEQVVLTTRHLLEHGFLEHVL